MLLSRWLVSTPSQTWVGGLTNNTNIMKIVFADDCQKGSKVQPLYHEPPLSPVQTIGRGGWVLLDLACSTDASGQKVRAKVLLFVIFLQNLFGEVW